MAWRPRKKKIVSINVQGGIQTVADGIVGHSILAANDGTLYVSEPGEHTDMPSRIWRIKKNGAKVLLDEGLLAASGIAFSPGGELFLAAEASTKWVYSYVVQPDGSLADKQPYYWLHMTDIPNNSGAEEHGRRCAWQPYVATRMGVQVCDQNGRVRAILPLPTHADRRGAFVLEGNIFDVLYVTDGRQVFKRPLKVPGHEPWTAPVEPTGQGAG